MIIGSTTTASNVSIQLASPNIGNTGGINFTLAGIPTAANNAAASVANVPVGGIYRTNADPSVLYIRSV